MNRDGAASHFKMENTHPIMERANKWFKARDYAKAYMERYTNNPYHNFFHAMAVASAAARICDKEDVDSYDSLMVITAALFHDAVFKVGAGDNEERSGRVARHLLYRAGYTRPERDMITRLILATKMPAAPKNLLEKVLCDADLDNLGRADFLDKMELVRKENGVSDTAKWYSCTLGFIKNHKYHTAYQQKSKQEMLSKNIAKLEERLEEFLSSSALLRPSSQYACT